MARIRIITNRYKENLFYLRKAQKKKKIKYINKEIFKVLSNSKTNYIYNMGYNRKFIIIAYI